MLDFDNLENSYVPERFGILNAYYVPDQAYQRLYPSITPVNSFRVILSQFLGASFDLLEYESYYSTKTKPYKFTNITDLLR